MYVSRQRSREKDKVRSLEHVSQYFSRKHVLHENQTYEVEIVNLRYLGFYQLTYFSQLYMCHFQFEARFIEWREIVCFGFLALIFRYFHLNVIRLLISFRSWRLKAGRSKMYIQCVKKKLLGVDRWPQLF